MLLERGKMQLVEPRCSKRNCIHYQGVEEFIEGDPLSQNHICDAFPNGIPEEISYGDNLHLKPLENQENEIVFEIQ
jgi:hypothetical protein